MRATLPILAAVCLGTGAAMTATVINHGLATEELAEVPLMASMFGAMVWHASRHQATIAELRRSAARELDFVRHASHQLRTPITVARGHVELLRAETVDVQSVEDTDIVITELDRLSRISDRLLLLATAEHVDCSVRAPVELAALVERTVRRWRPTAWRDWRLEVLVRGSVVGDTERLEAALDALVENALKATQPGDLVAVALRAEGSDAVIEVVDAGVGIAAQDRERIFDQFWTSASGAHDAARGTGLGLATVRAIARAHHGSAEALARPDGGTTMRMRLGDFTPRAAAAVNVP
jgi:two-component system OmpR family sensor kinase